MPQLAGASFFQPVKIGMLDSDGNAMDVVGIAASPWQVELSFKHSNWDSGSNRLVGKTVASFQVSGVDAGLAVFDSFGVENADTGIILEVSMFYPVNYRVVVRWPIYL